MTKKTPIIIITGYPGTGKSSIARKIADEFSLPMISKDEIKEILFQSLGWDGKEWSVKLGSASFDLMMFLTKKLAKTKKPFILETYFDKTSEKSLRMIAKDSNLSYIQIVCAASPDTILSRVEERVELGKRHPGHADEERYDELVEKLKSEYEPLDLKGPKIIVDTTDFKNVDYKKLYEFIGAALIS